MIFFPAKTFDPISQNIMTTVENKFKTKVRIKNIRAILRKLNVRINYILWVFMSCCLKYKGIYTAICRKDALSCPLRQIPIINTKI